MSLIQSKEQRDKILAERPEFSNLSLLIGLALIPLGLLIITTVAWLIMSPSNYLQAMPNLLKLLVTLTVIFGVLGVFALRRVHSAVMDAIKKPILITIGLFTNAAIFIFFVDPPFTDVEMAEFKKYWWIYALAWIIFPIIEHPRVKQLFAGKIGSKLIWLFRFPVWAVIFYSVFILVIVDGAALFGQLFDWLMCSGSGQCFSR